MKSRQEILKAVDHLDACLQGGTRMGDVGSPVYMACLASRQALMWAADMPSTFGELILGFEAIDQKRKEAAK